MTNSTKENTVSDERLAEMQRDCGIPNPPTQETYWFRKALAGEGPHAYDWSDKPHRLVFDLCRLIEADAALRSKPLAGVEVAANELGDPDEWKSKFEELASWTGSAWIAGEPSEDLRGDCYNFLCTLLGFMQSGEAAARHLSALLPKATAPVVSEPVAWRTEYRDVYRGHDTGWHYKYSETKPNPAPLVNGCGHRNVTPLYASPQPEAVITEEMVERAMASIEGEPDLFITKGALRYALEAALKEA